MRTAMTERNIVEIDEQKCDGCGLCVPACVEGAIQVVHGKAKLVSDVYCDGLGACLGQCPRGAITVTQREAVAFDEEAARRHVADAEEAAGPRLPGLDKNLNSRSRHRIPGRRDPPFCAGRRGRCPVEPCELADPVGSFPPGPAFLKHADLVLAADCVPFAYADFHRQIVRQRPT